MNTWRLLPMAILLIFVCISEGLSELAISITKTPNEISGSDNETGIQFDALKASSDLVIIDLYFGLKKVHAVINYKTQSLKIHSNVLSSPDILAFQKLFQVLSLEIGSVDLHGDALVSSR